MNKNKKSKLADVFRWLGVAILLLAIYVTVKDLYGKGYDLLHIAVIFLVGSGAIDAIKSVALWISGILEEEEAEGK